MSKCYKVRKCQPEKGGKMAHFEVTLASVSVILSVELGPVGLAWRALMAAWRDAERACLEKKYSTKCWRRVLVSRVSLSYF